jgi:hypothetical protein
MWERIGQLHFFDWMAIWALSDAAVWTAKQIVGLAIDFAADHWS